MEGTDGHGTHAKTEHQQHRTAICRYKPAYTPDHTGATKSTLATGTEAVRDHGAVLTAALHAHPAGQVCSNILTSVALAMAPRAPRRSPSANHSVMEAVAQCAAAHSTETTSGRLAASMCVLASPRENSSQAPMPAAAPLIASTAAANQGTCVQCSTD